MLSIKFDPCAPLPPRTRHLIDQVVKSVEPGDSVWARLVAWEDAEKKYPKYQILCAYIEYILRGYFDVRPLDSNVTTGEVRQALSSVRGDTSFLSQAHTKIIKDAIRPIKRWGSVVRALMNLHGKLDLTDLQWMRLFADHAREGVFQHSIRHHKPLGFGWSGAFGPKWEEATGKSTLPRPPARSPPKHFGYSRATTGGKAPRRQSKGEVST